MPVEEIAKALVQHCRNGTELEGLEALYDAGAVSIEPMSFEGRSAVSEGRDAIRAKHAWWSENFEVHSTEVDGPFINGDAFSVVFETDVTERASGARWSAREVALYETDGDKIVRERFFMMPMG